MPISVAPAWFRAAIYAWAAAGFGLGLLFIHHLRQLFLRVREGTPFDARNASRVRWLGLLLLAIDLLSKASSGHRFFLTPGSSSSPWS